MIARQLPFPWYLGPRRESGVDANEARLRGPYID
jgi:hypothetical protein